MEDLDEVNSENDSQNLGSEIAKKYKSAQEAVNCSKMTKNHIIDLVDTMVMRKRILPSLSSILKNLLLQNCCCFKRSCILRDKKQQK